MTFSEQWRITETVDFVVSNGYQIIALQFPDEHLEDCVLVVDALQQCLAELDHEAKVDFDWMRTGVFKCGSVVTRVSG